MARLVQPAGAPQAELSSGTSGAPNPTGDTYRERLVKYIPAETIAVYTFVDKAIINSGAAQQGTAVAPDQTQFILSIVIFVIALFGTPAYIWRSRVANQPWGLHAFIATLAFVAWAYTLGGSVFVYNGLYNTLVAAIVAPLFTYVAPLFEPRATN
jgi:phosphoglycerol transferase MdoB-like AlkP superfamily enzyme